MEATIARATRKLRSEANLRDAKKGAVRAYNRADRQATKRALRAEY